MTIECKDLEWRDYGCGFSADGVNNDYSVFMLNPVWVLGRRNLKNEDGEVHDTYPDKESAQAAANDHNKQQFNNIIEEWRKG